MPPAANGINGHVRSKSQSGILQGVMTSLESIDAGSFDNEGDRVKAVVAAYALVARLETPWEFLARIAMGQVGSPHSHLSRFASTLVLWPQSP